MTGLVGSAASNTWRMVRLMSASAWMCLFISPRYACSLASQPPRPESRSALSLGYLSISVLACIQRPSHRWVCVAPTLSVRRLYTFLFIDSFHPTAKAAHLACEAATDLLGPVASRVRRPFFWPPLPRSCGVVCLWRCAFQMTGAAPCFRPSTPFCRAAQPILASLCPTCPSRRRSDSHDQP